MRVDMVVAVVRHLRLSSGVRLRHPAAVARMELFGRSVPMPSAPLNARESGRNPGKGDSWVSHGSNRGVPSAKAFPTIRNDGHHPTPASPG